MVSKGHISVQNRDNAKLFAAHGGTIYVHKEKRANLRSDFGISHYSGFVHRSVFTFKN